MARNNDRTDEQKQRDAEQHAAEQQSDDASPLLGGMERIGAGEQFGEAPAPIPATNSPRPKTAAEQQEYLRRTDVKEVQPAPVVTGTRVVQETAQPDPGEAAKTAPAAQVVSVGPGDTLSTIARLVYGDENRAADIWEANKDRITSPDTLMVGTSLRIPS